MCLSSLGTDIKHCAIVHDETYGMYVTAETLVFFVTTETDSRLALDGTGLTGFVVSPYMYSQSFTHYVVCLTTGRNKGSPLMAI